MKMLKYSGLFILLLFLTACAPLGYTDSQQGPGIGSGTDDYKLSPCACKELKQRFKNQRVG